VRPPVRIFLDNGTGFPDAYESRAHDALKDLTPSEYDMKCRAVETTEVVQQAEEQL
jgi:hypothetical protein